MSKILLFFLSLVVFSKSLDLSRSRIGRLSEMLKVRKYEGNGLQQDFYFNRDCSLESVLHKLNISGRLLFKLRSTGNIENLISSDEFEKIKTSLTQDSYIMITDCYAYQLILNFRNGLVRKTLLFSRCKLQLHDLIKVLYEKYKIQFEAFDSSRLYEFTHASELENYLDTNIFNEQ